MYCLIFYFATVYKIHIYQIGYLINKTKICLYHVTRSRFQTQFSQICRYSILFLESYEEFYVQSNSEITYRLYLQLYTEGVSFVFTLQALI